MLLIVQTQQYTGMLGITEASIILWMAIQSNDHVIPSKSPVCGKNGSNL